MICLTYESKIWSVCDNLRFAVQIKDSLYIDIVLDYLAYCEGISGWSQIQSYENDLSEAICYLWILHIMFFLAWWEIIFIKKNHGVIE